MRFVAGRGAAAKSHLEDVAGRCADAEVFLAVGTMEKRHREADAGWSAAKRHREADAGWSAAKRHREAPAGWSAAKSHREAKAKKKAGARCLTSRLCATELCCCGENEIRTRDTL